VQLSKEWQVPGMLTALLIKLQRIMCCSPAEMKSNILLHLSLPLNFNYFI
jgi:hypothetical protein